MFFKALCLSTVLQTAIFHGEAFCSEVIKCHLHFYYILLSFVGLSFSAVLRTFLWPLNFPFHLCLVVHTWLRCRLTLLLACLSRRCRLPTCASVQTDCFREASEESLHLSLLRFLKLLMCATLSSESRLHFISSSRVYFYF